VVLSGLTAPLLLGILSARLSQFRLWGLSTECGYQGRHATRHGYRGMENLRLRILMTNPPDTSAAGAWPHTL